MEELVSGEGFLGLAHGLEDEVERRGVGGDVELRHLRDKVEELGGGGAEHKVGAEVVIKQINIGLVWFARLIEGADPGLEKELDVVPLLRGHPVAEEVEEGAGVVCFRRGAVVEAHGGERVGGGGGGSGRWRRDWAAPVFVVEGASGGGVGRERGG